MKVKRAVVRITRNRKTRDLEARVVQADAKGEVLGVDLLARKHVRRVVVAKGAVLDLLKADAEDVLFSGLEGVDDTPPPYDRTARRTGEPGEPANQGSFKRRPPEPEMPSAIEEEDFPR